MAVNCAKQMGAGFRGPPVPLVVVPVIYHLVRSNADLELTKHVRALVSRGGPASVAKNAHHIIQYLLSKVPSDVLFWFATKVLRLQPEVAMQTTEMLKATSHLQLSPPEQHDDVQPVNTEELVLAATAQGLPAPKTGIEQRLDKLEMECQALQKWRRMQPPQMGCLLRRRHEAESHKALAELLLQPDSAAELELQPCAPEPTQLGRGEAGPGPVGPWSARSAASEMETQALVQEVGLRLGTMVLSWAGNTMRQRLTGPAAPVTSSWDTSQVGAEGLAGGNGTGRVASLRSA